MTPQGQGAETDAVLFLFGTRLENHHTAENRMRSPITTPNVRLCRPLDGVGGGPSPSTGKKVPMIGFIVAGLVIGALARLIKPGKQDLSLLMTLLLGLVGSVIGGVIASLLRTGDIFELNMFGFVVAVIASVLLIGVAEGMGGRSRVRS